METFRTAGHDPRGQYDYWHSLVEKSFAACDGLAGQRRGFDAGLEVASCGAIELTALHSDPVTYHRRAKHIRQSGTDDYFFSVMLDGTGHFSQNDRAVRHDTGSVLIYDSARPYSYDYLRPYKALLLRAPRHMVESRFLGARDLGGTLLSAGAPQSGLIRALISNLIETAREDDLPEAFVTPAIDLIANAFTMGAPLSGASQDRRGAALDKVKRHMLEQLGDETLSVARICRETNMSVRSLNRAFAAEGTTPMTWLREQRLAEARSLLMEGRSPSVTETAYQCGFSDLSYFGRCFKKSFGITPKNAFSTGLSRH